MQDKFKTKEALLKELAGLRQRITELETSQTSFEQAEERIARFASFPHLNPNPVLEVDSSGEITFFNQAAEKALEDLGMDRSAVKSFLPEDLRAVLRDWDKKDKPPLLREVIISDRVFSENIHFAPQYNVARIYATDVTERKRMEKETRQLLNAVQEEKNRLSALLNSIQDEVWFADTEKRFTLINPSALQEFGLDVSSGEITVEELVRSLEVYRSDGSPRPVDEAPPLRALRGEAVRNQEEIIRTPARGDLRHREVNSAPVRDRDGTVIGSLSVVRDITERKRMEQELRQSERLYRAIGESINYGVWVCAPDGRNIYASESFLKMVGQTQEECSSFGWGNVLHPDDAERTIARMAGVCPDGRCMGYRTSLSWCGRAISSRARTGHTCPQRSGTDYLLGGHQS